jgi:hypothetical protein
MCDPGKKGTLGNRAFPSFSFCSDAALPPAPLAPTLIPEDAASGNAAAGSAEVPPDEADMGATSEVLLPPPGYGAASSSVFLRWDCPPLPPAGHAPVEFQVQQSAKWALGWVDSTLTTVASAGAAPASASSTAQPRACVSGLQPATVYTFRVRSRNSNGWGPWSAKSEEFATTAAVVAPPPAPTAAASQQQQQPAAPPAPPVEPPPAPTTLTQAAMDAAATGNLTALRAIYDAPAAAQPESAEATASAAEAPAEPSPAADAAGSTTATSASEESAQLLPHQGNDLLRVIDPTHWRTVLHFAAHSGHAAVVNWAVTMGAQLEARDRVGATPLLLAVVGGEKA